MLTGGEEEREKRETDDGKFGGCEGGEFLEPMGGLPFRFVEAGESGSDGQGEVKGAIFFLGQKPGETDDFLLMFARERGDGTGAFAHFCLGIDRAFGSDDEIGGANFFFQSREAGEDVKAGFKFSIEKNAETITEAAGCSGARLFGRFTPEVATDNFREPGEGLVRDREIFEAQTFLRAVNAGGAFGAEQLVLHVRGDGDFAEVRGGFGRPDVKEGVESDPPVEAMIARVEEPKAKAAGESKAGVVGRAATDADDQARTRMGFGDVKEELAEAEGVEFEGMETSGRQHGETDDIGALDDGGAGRFTPPPSGVDRFVRGVERAGGLARGVKKIADDGAKPIAAITHGKEFERVVRARRAPASRDSLGGFVSAQGSLEFIRDNENSAHVLESKPVRTEECKCRKGDETRNLGDAQPDRFQVGGFFLGDGEIRGLGDVVLLEDGAAGGGAGGLDLGEEGFGREFLGVGGGEKDAAGAEQGKDGGNEFSVVFFSLKGSAGFGMGKGGWVEEDEVKEAIFFSQTRSPIEKVAIDEIVSGGIELVVGEVAPAPFEILFGEVEAGGASAGKCGADGESAGVGEGVQNFFASEGVRKEVKIGCDVVGEEAAAVVALIEKKSDGIALPKTDFIANAVFEDGEGFGSGGAREVLRLGFVGGGAGDVFSELFLVERGVRGIIYRRGCREAAGKLDEFGGIGFGGCLGEQVIGPFFDVKVGVAIGCAVEKANGAGERGLDECSAEGEVGWVEEIRFRAEGDRLASGWVIEGKFVGVEADTRESRAVIGGVAEDGDFFEFGVDADLVGAPGEGFGGEEVERGEAGAIRRCSGERAHRRGVLFEVSKTGFGGVAVGSGGVAVARAGDAGVDGEVFFSGGSGGEEEVPLVDLAGGELLGEGLAGEFGFREDEEAGGGFIQAVNGGEARPAWFALAKPIINTFARVRGGGMGVEARWFVDHEEMVILVQDAGRQMVYQNFHASL